MRQKFQKNNISKCWQIVHLNHTTIETYCSPQAYEYSEQAYQFCTRLFTTLIAAESSPQSYQHLDRMLTTIASVLRQNAKPQSYQYRWKMFTIVISVLTLNVNHIHINIETECSPQSYHYWGRMLTKTYQFWNNKLVTIKLVFRQNVNHIGIDAGS